VTVLFVGSTAVLTSVEAQSDEPDVVVDVVAQQFGWSFTYEDSGIVAYGRTAPPSTSDPAPPGLEVVLPVDKSIRFRLTAKDVIHSFYVPAFFYKMDAIPGRINEFELTIERPGIYGGQCAEFCGLLHGQMFFSIHAVSPETYEAWVASGGTLQIPVDAEEAAEPGPAEAAEETA
jgi:cytochrome c oxidase subunit 2